MSTETAISTCDWCERPATRGFGPATGATHHICSVHDAAPDLLAALKKAWAEADWSGVDGDTMEEVANLIALAEEDA